MAYGITKEELHPSLLEYIQSIAENITGNTLKYLKSSTILSGQSSEVSIGISAFNKDTDLLMVYKNSVYMECGYDYNISSDSLKIIATNGESWINGTLFNFICLSNVQELQEYIDGKKISLGSVSLDKLDSELQSIITSNSTDNVDGGIF